MNRLGFMLKELMKLLLNKFANLTYMDMNGCLVGFA